MKALLLIPPSKYYMRETRCQAPFDKVMVECVRTPISLASIAGVLQQEGAICKIRDCQAENLSWQDLRNEISSFNPDMVITQTTKHTFEKDAQVYILAKAIGKNIKTVAFGGFLKEGSYILESCDKLDIFVYEEPEHAFRKIAKGEQLKDTEGISYRESIQIRENNPPVLIENLDNLPFPERGLLKNELYRRPDNLLMQTELKVSRGCPGECIFCLAPVAYGKRIRLRSPENIINEIEECIVRFGIKDFFFRSDTFTWEKNWVLEICKRIKEKNLGVHWCCNSRVDTINENLLSKMKDAGCWLISFGIESGSQKILDAIKKNINLEICRKTIGLCKKIGIKTYLNFMIGFPWDNKETIMQTLNFAKELDGDLTEFPLVMPFSGTELYNLAVKGGLISDNESVPMPTYYLSQEEVFSLWRNVVLSYYCRPGYIYKTLLNAFRQKTLLNYLRFGCKKISSIYCQRQ
jgi:anaerobic magnesium-protoporphyrin IX monomethyl ester cyclase